MRTLALRELTCVSGGSDAMTDENHPKRSRIADLGGSVNQYIKNMVGIDLTGDTVDGNTYLGNAMFVISVAFSWYLFNIRMD